MPPRGGSVTHCSLSVRYNVRYNLSVILCTFDETFVNNLILLALKLLAV